MSGGDTRRPSGPTWQRRDALATTQVDEDAFVVDPASEEVFHLNALGRALWQELATAHTMDELVTAVTAAFPGVPDADIARDVANFLTALERAGLLRRAD